MTVLARLTDPPDRRLDGGKGYNLKILAQAGFEVPPAVIITSAFYANRCPPPPDFRLDDPAALAAECEAFRRIVGEGTLPPDLQGELAGFFGLFSNEARFAVRSSSIFEDLAGAAFAGQHETFLNLATEEVGEKVLACLASLWSPHAVLYRAKQGFSQREASMAVVVQRMVRGDAAGVAFSIDPVSGHFAQALIEGNLGVGESVVGGEATTDSWVVDAGRGTIVERRVREKEYALYAGERGLTKVALPREDRLRPALDDDQILQVAALTRRVMEHYGSPQDLEWVFEKGKLFLVQARPQTTIPPRFTRDESAERFPDPLTPLTWSYVQKAFNRSLEHSLALMKVSLPTRPWFELKDGYVYGNQNAVRLLAMTRPVKARNFDELLREIPALRERYAWVRELPAAWMRDLDRYLLRIGRLSGVSLDGLSCRDSIRAMRDLFEAASEYFLPNIAISMTQAFLAKVLFQIIRFIVPDDLQAGGMFKKVIAVPETKTGQINRELHAIAGMVKEDASLRAWVGDRTVDRWTGIDTFPAFAERVRRFLSDYGHRETSFDYYHPTWAEAPETVLDLIALTASSAPAEEPAARERRVRLQQWEATRELFDRTPKEVHFFLQELIRLTLSFTFLDDLEHFQTTRVNLQARKMLGRFGRELQASGQVADPYDVFFLTGPELEGLDEFALSPALKTAILERKRAFLEAGRREPAWSLDEEAPAPPPEEAGVLKGIPGSAGEVEGAVYTVRGVEDFAGMPDGAILVAKTTNPAWTPLFYKARGVVTESGGPLSHGAITARELGLPAVMNVRDCLSLLSNGDRVRVHGGQGLVRVLGTADRNMSTGSHPGKPGPSHVI